jgi:hypothetical protein
MKNFPNKMLSKTCVLTWLIILVIIVLGMMSHISSPVLSFYTGIIKGLFWVFWGLIFLSLFLLIYSHEEHVLKVFQKRKLKGKKVRSDSTQSNSKRRIRLPFSGILAFLLVIPVLFLVIESYMLIEKIAIMWIFIFVLSLLAILGKLLSGTPPQNRIIRFHFAFILALSISLYIFHSYGFSKPFYDTFIKSAGIIDHYVFGQAAAKVGDNYNEVMKQKIHAEVNLTSIQDAPTHSFLDTFETYTEKLKLNNLSEELMPGKILPNKKTIHAQLVKKAFKSLKNGQASRMEKQHIVENLLDYLASMAQPGRFDKIRFDPDYPLSRRLLEKIIDSIKIENLGEITDIRLKLKNLYCALTQNTTINAYVIKKFLGEEVEPCPEN